MTERDHDKDRRDRSRDRGHQGRDTGRRRDSRDRSRDRDRDRDRGKDNKEKERERSRGRTNVDTSVKGTEDEGRREKQRLAVTSTGHSAGIHSAASFGQEEKQLRREREKALEEFNRQNADSNADTVYRDKKGRKLDMLSEFMRQQALAEGKKVAIQQAQFEWGLGAVQKKDHEEAQKELVELADEPFARMANDPKLEKIRKGVIRDGDPMADYFVKKQEKTVPGSTTTSRTGKPLYKGPNPTPNRFGIRPGYRWDAVDRSNGFEQKALTKLNEKSAFKEDEYKWSVSDL